MRLHGQCRRAYRESVGSVRLVSARQRQKGGQTSVSKRGSRLTHAERPDFRSTGPPFGESLTPFHDGRYGRTVFIMTAPGLGESQRSYLQHLRVFVNVSISCPSYLQLLRVFVNVSSSCPSYLQLQHVSVNVSRSCPSYL